MSIVSELKRRKVFRVAVGYIISAWVLIQVVETIFPAFGLDDEAFRMLVIALAIGFIPAVILSWAFELTRGGLVPERNAQASPSSDPISIMSVLRRPGFAVPLLAAFLAAAGAITALTMQLRESQTARQELVPRAEALFEQGDMMGAYALALEAEEYLPEDPVLAELFENVAVTMSFMTEPAGAEVAYRRYTPGDGDWISLGTTPIETVRLPRAVLHWKFQKAGHETAVRTGESFNGKFRIELAEGTLPEGMLRVPGKSTNFLLTGYERRIFEVPAFKTDRHEVTNAEYLEFVLGGGYDNPELWAQLEFVVDGHEIAWEDAMDRFRDQTGRHGPAIWEGGRFPQEEGQHPVSGISWFEAAAYARFRGKDLPTMRHWSSMTLRPASEEIAFENDVYPGFGLIRSEMAALSNFSESGVEPVGQNMARTPFGAFDAAGNVREWIWNATADDGEMRYILGGTWREPAYLYTYGVAKSPWDRSDVNGMRLVSYDQDQDHVEALRAPVPLPAREVISPVSDEVFSVYRSLFDYDPTPLNIRTESAARAEMHWTRETVSFDATYGNERVLAHVFLPKDVDPPYQVVVYYPSSDATFFDSLNDVEISFFDFIIQSGRAVVVPVMWGTYERKIGLETTWPQATREYSDNVVRWIQDFRRTVDYLETREDIDLDRLGFLGYSWGGWNGPVVMALDERFRTGVYLSGGIPPTLARPEASSASYASRVTQPVLMISGTNDVIRPVETYQAPMFESLGTPSDLKRHAILEGGHLPPKPPIVSETLQWLDRHLGPVE